MSKGHPLQVVFFICLGTNNSQATNKTHKQFTSNLSPPLRYRGIFPDRLNTFIIMDNVEKVICCDRGNDALAYAAMANKIGRAHV